MTLRNARYLTILAAVATCATGALAAPQAPDPGRKACAQEARRLCPAEMKSFSRKKVEACMIVKIQQTSPTCRAAMLAIKAQREQAAAKR